MNKWLRFFLIAAGALLILLLVIQFVPLNRDNPPVTSQVRWDSPQTQDIFQRACADCHSNETVWPWYSRVAPVSFLVVRDVHEGREKFNISDLADMRNRELEELPEEIEEVIGEGEMPMGVYVMMHPEANLSDQERQALIQGLQQTLANTR